MPFETRSPTLPGSYLIREELARFVGARPHRRNDQRVDLNSPDGAEISRRDVW
jgi:hypothetical protein